MAWVRQKGAADWLRVCWGVDLQDGRYWIVRGERVRGRIQFTPVARGETTVAAGAAPAVAGCLSVRESLARWLETPFPSVAKAERVFPTLLDIELPFPVEECLCQFTGTHGEETRVRTLAVAARRPDIEKKVASLAAAGLDPLTLDHQGVALWTQSIQEIPPARDGSGLRAIVYLNGTQVVLVIGAGTQYLGTYGIPGREAAHIHRILTGAVPVAAGTARPVVTWFWTGPDAKDAGVVDALRRGLEKDWPGPSVVHAEPDLFLPRALVTRALTSGPLRCNLRKDDLAHPDMVERDIRQKKRAVWHVLIAGLLLCAAGIGWQVRTAFVESRLERKAAVLAEQVAGYRVTGAGSEVLAKARLAMKRRTAQVAPFKEGRDPSLLGILGEIMRVGASNDMQFASVEMTRRQVSIVGSAGDWNRCEKLSRALTSAGYRVQLERKESLAEERVNFRIASRDDDE